MPRRSTDDAGHQTLLSDRPTTKPVMNSRTRSPFVQSEMCWLVMIVVNGFRDQALQMTFVHGYPEDLADSFRPVALPLLIAKNFQRKCGRHGSSSAGLVPGLSIQGLPS